MEIADMVVINKYDSEFKMECKRLKVTVEGNLEFTQRRFEDWKVPVVLASAHKGFGIDAIWENISKFRDGHREDIKATRRTQNKEAMWHFISEILMRE
jgi:putative protein kinase ArgK-like GTPase of G3E family